MCPCNNSKSLFTIRHLLARFTCNGLTDIFLSSKISCQNQAVFHIFVFRDVCNITSYIPSGRSHCRPKTEHFHAFIRQGPFLTVDNLVPFQTSFFSCEYLLTNRKLLNKFVSNEKTNFGLKDFVKL